MKLDRKALIQVLASVAFATDPNAYVPALRCVRVYATASGDCFVEATNLDVYSRAKLNAANEGRPETYVINAKALTSALKTMRGSDVTIRAADDQQSAIVSDGAASATLTMRSADYYPNIPLPAENHGASYDARTIAHAIACVIHAASRDVTRKWLNCVLIKRTHEKLVAVATDGHRLALHETQEPSGTEFEHIIPLDVVKVLAKRSKGSVRITRSKVGETCIHYAYDDGFVTGHKLVDETFPPYEDVIPRKEDTKSMTVDVDECLTALRLHVQASKKNALPTILECADGVLHMRTNDDDSNIATKALVVSRAPPLRVGVSACYLQQAMEAIQAEGIRVVDIRCGVDIPKNHKGSIAPILIETSRLTLVVMPMRV